MQSKIAQHSLISETNAKEQVPICIVSDDFSCMIKIVYYTVIQTFFPSLSK